MKLLIYFVIILFIPLAFSQPFVTESSSGIIDQTFSVVVPSEVSFKKDSTISLIANVFNDTGRILTNSDGLSCTLELYGANNEILERKLMGNSNEGFNVTIDSSITSSQGEHNYMIFCNTSTQGGFRTAQMTITQSGFQKSTEQALLLILLLSAVIMFSFALVKKDTNFGFISGFIFSIIGIYLLRYGYLGIQNFLSDSISIILLGIGSYVLFRASIERLEEAES